MRQILLFFKSILLRYLSLSNARVFYGKVVQNLEEESVLYWNSIEYQNEMWCAVDMCYIYAKGYLWIQILNKQLLTN